MQIILSSPITYLVLCIVTYRFGLFIQKKTGIPLFNPILISITLICAFLILFQIRYETFESGGRFITLFLYPATVMLAIPIARQAKILKKFFIPIITGCLIGSATSIVSVIVLCRLFGLSEDLTMSLAPKSVTTPIAFCISSMLQAIPPITIICVILTGITGVILSPLLIKLGGLTKDEVASGIAIGTSSHALGTAKALELSPVIGAMSGVSMGISGIITVILFLFM